MENSLVLLKKQFQKFQKLWPAEITKYDITIFHLPPLFSLVRYCYYINVVNNCLHLIKGGVHRSRIKCKVVQLSQINWQELVNFLKNVVEHPFIELKNWMLFHIFNTFQYSNGCSYTFFRKWTSFYQLLCVT